MVSVANLNNRLRIVKATITSADFTWSAANQTAQGVKVLTLPYGSTILDFHVVNSGGTWTNSATLSAVNITAGVSSGDASLLGTTNIKTAATAALYGSRLATAPTALTSIYVTFTPVGAGGNWNAMTNTTANTKIDVYMAIVDFVTVKPTIS